MRGRSRRWRRARPRLPARTRMFPASRRDGRARPHVRRRAPAASCSAIRPSAPGRAVPPGGAISRRFGPSISSSARYRRPPSSPAPSVATMLGWCERLRKLRFAEEPLTESLVVEQAPRRAASERNGCPADLIARRDRPRPSRHAPGTTPRGTPRRPSRRDLDAISGSSMAPKPVCDKPPCGSGSIRGSVAVSRMIAALFDEEVVQMKRLMHLARSETAARGAERGRRRCRFCRARVRGRSLCRRRERLFDVAGSRGSGARRGHDPRRQGDLRRGCHDRQERWARGEGPKSATIVSGGGPVLTIFRRGGAG